jgi:threonine/homoserine/homoserine lactone efflux protein
MPGLLTVIPMAIVMSAGPQIVTATFLATSRDAKRNSIAFLVGVATATAIGVTVFYAIGGGITDEDSGKSWLDWVIIGLLAFLALWVFLKRNEEKEPPKWMGKLEHADVRFSARIGLLLYLLMPTDIITMATVGAFLASEGEPLWHGVGFLVATLLIAGLPLIMLLVLGARSETLLPSIRGWMNDNSWIVNEAVILFFLAMALFG